MTRDETRRTAPQDDNRRPAGVAPRPLTPAGRPGLAITPRSRLRAFFRPGGARLFRTRAAPARAWPHWPALLARAEHRLPSRQAG